MQRQQVTSYSANIFLLTLLYTQESPAEFVSLSSTEVGFDSIRFKKQGIVAVVLDSQVAMMERQRWKTHVSLLFLD
jgi:hypothetical protein